jgi:endoglucanase
MQNIAVYKVVGVLCSCILLLCSNMCIGQTEQRISISSVTASEDTGQDYSSWLSDDLTNLVPDAWQNNFKYVDVTLQLSKRSTITRLSLYDFKGTFDDNPAEIYALNGTTKTLITKFTGPAYMAMQDVNLPQPIQADAIIVHKYCNNIPQKVFIYGYAVESKPSEPTTPVAPTPPTTPVATNPVVNPQVPSVVTPANPAPDPIQSTPAEMPGGMVKIPIDGKRWYQINSGNDGIADLFNGVVDIPISYAWGKIFNNYDAWYPVAEGESITLSAIKLYDGSGSLGDHPFTVSVVTSSGNRIPIATFTGEKYNEWVGPYPERNLAGEKQFELDKPLTDIKYIVLNCWYMFPTEVEFYGTYKAGYPITEAPKKAVPFNHYFGVNAFEWDFEDPNQPYKIDENRLKAMKTFTQVRHYLDWQRIEQQQGSYTFSPSHEGGWDYDALYQRCKAEGIEVLADIKTLPNWMLDTYPADQRDNENVPVKYGSDFSNPVSYIEQARLGFQFAARYGSNGNVNASLLNVNQSQRWTGDGINTVKQGTGLVNYIECENERDKWWKGRKAYQSAYEYAANLSAFYDGHKNTMGPGVGVKNADPNMQVVMAGLASPNTDYLRAMVDWCKLHRGYRADGSINLCWDVINYHLYSNDAKSSQGGNATRGMAPEVGETAQVAQDFIATAHQYAADMPVWVTELGYDVNQGSYLKAIPIGDKSALQTQADWILRSALLYARERVDRIFFYQAYDDNPTSSIQFGSSGLLNADRTRKPAADYLYQAQKLLGDYVYKQTLQKDPIVDRYEYNGQSAYALVVPDEKGRSVNYTLNLGNADSASVYSPKIGSDQMALKKVKLNEGELPLTVTETPIFVIPIATKVGNFAANTMFAASSDVGRVDTTQVNIINSTLKVYPNPATDYINVSFNNKQSGLVTIKVTDARTGRIHLSESFNKTSEEFTQRINLNSVPFGVCLVEIVQGNIRTVKQVIKPI